MPPDLAQKGLTGEVVAANEKVVVALIGCGGMGNGDLDDFMRDPAVEVAAVCDVDDNNLNTTADKVEKKPTPPPSA